MIAKTGEEILGFGLFGPASFLFAWRGREGVSLPSERENISVLFQPRGFLFSRERGSLLTDPLVHREQQVKHGFGPLLFLLFEQKHEFPQVMGVTEAVVTVIGEIGLPEVVDQAATKIRDDVEIFDGRFSPFLVHAVKSQHGRTGTVEPVEFPGRADAAFIDMEDGPLAERLFDNGLKRRQRLITLAGGLGNGGVADT